MKFWPNRAEYLGAYAAALAGIFITGCGNILLAIPPESSLPGMLRTSKIQKELPSESKLPGTLKANKLPQLPSERALPVALTNAQAAAAQPDPANALQNASLKAVLAASRDERIRLRLSVDEHTSNIMTVAFDTTSTHLFTGSDDKVVHHWQLTQIPGKSNSEWVHQETIRWQVGSGQVGRIRATACYDNVLYLAGYGAEGSRGEIVRYDWTRRVWLETWVDHSRPILKLFAAPDGKILSVDEHFGIGVRSHDGTQKFQSLQKPMNARPLFWPVSFRVDGNKVKWYSAVKDSETPWRVVGKASENDAVTETYIPIIAKQSESQVFRQQVNYLAGLDNKRAAAVRDEKKRKDAYAKWATSFGPELMLAVVSPTGRSMAAVDVESTVKNGDGNWLYIWKDQKLVVKFQPTTFENGANEKWDFRRLAWSADGKSLAVVLIKSVKGVQTTSLVDIWDLSANIPAPRRVLEGTDEYFDCQFSSDGKWLALGGRRSARLLKLDSKTNESVRIPSQGNMLAFSDVSFATSGYQWKGTHVDGSIAFAPDRMALDSIDGKQWQPTLDRTKGWKFGAWQIQRESNGFQVMQGTTKIGLVDPIDSARPLDVTVACWVQGTAGKPIALAVVYEKFLENEIHLFGLDKTDNGKLRRMGVLNGHEGKVQSLSVSSDQKYLLSSGFDRLVCYWPLSQILRPTEPPENSWQKYGANFALENGTLTVSEASTAGPLYEFGLRAGDEITSVTWFAPSEDGTVAVPQDIPVDQAAIDYLNRADFNTIVKFGYRRGGVNGKQVQLKPHWRPLITQSFSVQREWAAWTAPGFYTSSFNGNAIFGWQVNRGNKTKPDFYRADRFQGVLERPELLKRVLIDGSVHAAAISAGERVGNTFDPLTNAIALLPSVKITTPSVDAQINSNWLTIKAEIEMPNGSNIASLKAFANGVPASLIEQRAETPSTNGKVRYATTWRSGLPADRDIKLQVAIANSEKIVGMDEVVVHQNPSSTQRTKPKLWLFAGGVGKYKDRGISELKTPENNVEAFSGWIERASQGIYDCQIPMTLTGPSMTRNNWLAVVNDRLVELRKTVQPDDVVIIFLSGHGLQDKESGEYYFVPANALRSDVVSGQMSDCLGINEIAPFADLACRKIVILDTCHSGALQPLDADQLKVAVRALQADLVLTLTASEGLESAAEEPGKQLSLFTDVIGSVFRSPSDSDNDKFVSWPEFTRQVSEGVVKRSNSLAKLGVRQTPTVVPADLLPYIRLPLTTIAPTKR